MPAPGNPLTAAIKLLSKAHPSDPGAEPAPRDPWERILWENVGYLVDDDRRAEVFGALAARVTVDPSAILATPRARLAAVIARGGMQPDMRAEKLRECARLATEIGLDTLRREVDAASARAMKLLKRFPGIGEPGADKLMLLAGRKRCLAPESNGLRVLLRLGFGVEEKSYQRSYRSAEAAVAPLLPKPPTELIRAHELLRRHGQEICRRTQPRCEICPLTDSCAWFRHAVR